MFNATTIKNFRSGFSLLELLIVVSILVIVASMGFGLYFNYGKSVQVTSLAETIVFDLKQAQSKSMTGVGNLKWGIHFVNADLDYYEIFSSPTDYSNIEKVIVSTNYLSDGIIFSTPTSNSTIDIIFNKISGSTIGSSVSITSNEITKTISVSSLGSVSVQ
jgi:prepilin-type N-terminal cleavage/methylation domain-containing protein